MTSGSVTEAGVSLSQRRARDTRSALLEAARAVFTEVGYAEANVADVVARAGSSVGSMYHHFGGKADLYLALYDEHQSRQESRADSAVREGRAGGEQDTIALFIAGSRAFLHGCWEERDLAVLFLSGDGPTGFEKASRERFQAWVRRNGRLLGDGAEEHLLGEPFTLVLTTVNAAAGREVAMQPDEAAAYSYADDVLILLGRIGRG